MIIEIEQREGLCILRCKGRFIAGPDVDYMQSRLRDIQRLESRAVIADFSEVRSLGSIGVTFIVGIYTSVRRFPQGRFVLAGANPFVRRVLDLTRMSELISLAPDMASAMESLTATKDCASLKTECNPVVPCQADF